MSNPSFKCRTQRILAASTFRRRRTRTKNITIMSPVVSQGNTMRGLSSNSINPIPNQKARNQTPSSRPLRQPLQIRAPHSNPIKRTIQPFQLKTSNTLLNSRGSLNLPRRLTKVDLQSPNKARRKKLARNLRTSVSS